jgi:hypothetical protein
VTAIALVKLILPLDHHAEMLVVEDKSLGSNLFNVRRCQFLHVHEK